MKILNLFVKILILFISHSLCMLYSWVVWLFGGLISFIILGLRHWPLIFHYFVLFILNFLQFPNLQT